MLVFVLRLIIWYSVWNIYVRNENNDWSKTSISVALDWAPAETYVSLLISSDSCFVSALIMLYNCIKAPAKQLAKSSALASLSTLGEWTFNMLLLWIAMFWYKVERAFFLLCQYLPKKEKEKMCVFGTPKLILINKFSLV